MNEMFGRERAEEMEPALEAGQTAAEKGSEAGEMDLTAAEKEVGAHERSFGAAQGDSAEEAGEPETMEAAGEDAGADMAADETDEDWDESEEGQDGEDEQYGDDGQDGAVESDKTAGETKNDTENNEIKEKKEDAQEVVDSASLASIEPLLDQRIVRAVREMGFEKLTPIQVQAIPYLLDGEDIIGQAQTGTGKTAAFAIPALQKIDPDLRKLQTIILCPTRELAMQAAEEIRNIAKFMHGIKVLPVYGGQEISKQIKGLRDVQIIVGTPGRVMDHMRRRTVKLDYVNMVVLDEADEMLDMGFREDMELILGEIPNAHQTALFSATMPQPILDIANQFQKDARLVRVAAKELTIPLVSQRYYRVKSQDKDAACIRLLEYYQPKLCLIFCNTKIKVDELAEVLKKADFRVEGLHGDMSQHQRDVAMNHFRNGSTNILIATDVAARGIDVDNVEVVINYDLPQDNEYYVHRIGRTGRAGKTGRSFTFVSGRELYRVRQIERFCRTTIEEKKLPGAAKVMKAKADKYMNQAWELRDHEEIDLMKSYLQRKMDEEDCDALELAAAMLKYHIGDIGPEIEEDDYESSRSRRDRDRRRGGRGRRGREDDRDSRRRRDREESRDDAAVRTTGKAAEGAAGKTTATAAEGAAARTTGKRSAAAAEGVAVRTIGKRAEGSTGKTSATIAEDWTVRTTGRSARDVTARTSATATEGLTVRVSARAAGDPTVRASARAAEGPTGKATASAGGLTVRARGKAAGGLTVRANGRAAADATGRGAVPPGCVT